MTGASHLAGCTPVTATLAVGPPSEADKGQHQRLACADPRRIVLRERLCCRTAQSPANLPNQATQRSTHRSRRRNPPSDRVGMQVKELGKMTQCRRQQRASRTGFAKRVPG